MFCHFMITKVLVLVLASVNLASAGTAAGWAQCGGAGYTGPTSCASGFYCILLSSSYSLCEPWDGQISQGLPQAQPTTMQTMASSSPTPHAPVNQGSQSLSESSHSKTSKSASTTTTVTTTVSAASSGTSTSVAAMGTSISIIPSGSTAAASTSVAPSSSTAAAPTTASISVASSSSAAASPTSSAGSHKSSATSSTDGTSTTVSIAASSSSDPSPSAGSGNGQYLGRVNPSTGELSWPGTGLRFSYNGNAVIQLTATGSNSGDLIIDGTTSVIPSVTTDIPLPSGQHSVEFRKRSEATYGSIFVKTGGSPVSSKRLIEFIGDSITAGYGLDGVGPDCTNTAQIEDNPETYAALAADALDADYNIVAWSGKGIVRNYNGDNGPLMTELWTRYGANDADNTYTFTAQPQVVVINLGTNDFSSAGRDALDPSTYQAAMSSFIKTVESKYPQATFFLMGSPMLTGDSHTQMDTALQDVADSLGAHFVDWPTQGSAMGCEYHPNADTHAAEASVLASAIQSVMNW